MARPPPPRHHAASAAAPRQRVQAISRAPTISSAHAKAPTGHICMEMSGALCFGCPLLDAASHSFAECCQRAPHLGCQTDSVGQVHPWPSALDRLFPAPGGVQLLDDWLPGCLNLAHHLSSAVARRLNQNESRYGSSFRIEVTKTNDMLTCRMCAPGHTQDSLARDLAE